jgi:hypothetical protein
MKKRLSHFEAIAQRLVEGSFGRLFGESLQPQEIGSRLAKAMEDSEQNGEVADSYRVLLNPADHQSLHRRDPELAHKLSAYLVQLAQQANLTLQQQPDVEIVADPSLGRQSVLVEAEHSQPTGGSTEYLARNGEERTQHLLKAVDAFLIIEGKRHVPLDQPIMSIGRRTDNDIVVDSPAVSRQHAQLRWRYGRFVIYDLGSRGGTAVNGQPVAESVLHAGDVITLSGVPLIYGEEMGRDDAERRPVVDDGENQVTLTLPRDEV